MPRSSRPAIVLTGALALGLCLAAPFKVRASAIELKQPPPPPLDPKKKMPGDRCKDSSECQAHHRCVKEGDSSVCQAPPPHRLPPGAVT